MSDRARILLIDDDPHLLDAASRLFGKAGYAVSQAQTGAEGLRLAAEQKPDLILLDVALPDIDGIEVCRRVKTTPHLAGCFVILVGDARTASDDPASGLEAGADGFIVRPVSNRELLARVEALLRIKRAEQALAHERAELRATLYGIGDAVITTDIHGCVARMNRVAEQLTGWSETEAAGRPLDEVFGIVNEETRLPVENPVRRVLCEGVVVGLANHTLLMARDGREIPIADSGAPILTPQGDISGVVLVFRDQTAERAAQELLRESEDRFRYVFEAANVGKSVTLPGGEINVNKAFADMLGYTREELKGKTWQELTPPDEVAAVRKVLAPLLEGAQDSARLTKRYVHKDGSHVWADVSIAMRRDDEGQPLYFVTTIVDITERKRAEGALQESEEKYRTFVQQSLQGVVIAQDNPVRLCFASQPMQAITGFSPQELTSFGPQQLAGLIHPEDRATFFGNFRARLAGQAVPPRREYRVLHKNGDTRWVEIYSTPIEYEGSPATQTVFLDITERKQAEEALRRNERFLQNVFDAIQDGISVLDTDLNIIRTNRWMEQMYGHQMPLADRKCYQAYQQRQSPCPWCPSLETIETGETRVEIVPYPSADDPQGWIELSAFPLSDEQERVTGVIEYVKDITQRVQTVEALRESEEKYRLLAETTHDIILLHDMEGRIVYVNQAGLDFAGFEQSEAIGRPITAFIVAEHLAGVVERQERRAAGNSQPYAYQTEFVNRAGERIPVEVSSTPVLRQGQVNNVLVVARNITERKQAEEERERLMAQVRGQARQMEQVINTVPAGVLLLDAAGRVLRANPVAESYLAVLADAQAGQRLTHLGGRPLAELLTSPPTRGLWHEIQAANRYFELIARPMENGAQAEQWVMVINDVTREREIRAQLQQQEQLAAVGQLAAGIAHDFNNIMAVIVLYTQMGLRTPDLPTKLQERLQTISEQAKRATDLIQQILDFSRRAMLERRPMDLMPFMKEMVKLLERTIPEHIKVRLSYGSDEYTVHADPTRMQQIVMNLAVNARDAMPDGGRLDIGLERVVVRRGQSSLPPDMEAGDWIKVTVSDSGRGIPPDVLPHVFEPFFTTKGPGEGTGLGLAQVYGIVSQHGGRIDVETQVGRGTTFTIYLPALKVRPAEPALSDITALPQGQGQVLLVVEDEATLRAALVASLEQLNYQTLQAVNGEQALAVMEQQREQIDLVLSDVVMPGMGGIALFRALRQRGHQVPLILLTGHAMARELDALREQGLAAWLTKPPRLERLAQEIDSALHRPQIDDPAG
ncbi:MAG: PAS domain S-box protein [Chloroflexota bacterium]